MTRPADAFTACRNCGAMLERAATRCHVCGAGPGSPPPRPAEEKADAKEFALVHVADLWFLRDLAEHLQQHGIAARLADPDTQGQTTVDQGRMGLFVRLGQAHEADALIDEYFDTHMPSEAPETSGASADPSVCPGCGAQAAAQASVCVSCGLAFPEADVQCLVCGHQCPAGTRRCPGCGTDFGTATDIIPAERGGS